MPVAVVGRWVSGRNCTGELGFFGAMPSPDTGGKRWNASRSLRNGAIGDSVVVKHT